MHLEEQPHGEQDDLYFITWEDGVALSTSNYYTDDRPGIGGIYGGEVTVPPTIFSHWFSKEVEVVAIDGFTATGLQCFVFLRQFVKLITRFTIANCWRRYISMTT